MEKAEGKCSLGFSKVFSSMQRVATLRMQGFGTCMGRKAGGDYMSVSPPLSTEHAHEQCSQAGSPVWAPYPHAEQFRTRTWVISSLSFAKWAQQLLISLECGKENGIDHEALRQVLKCHVEHMQK